MRPKYTDTNEPRLNDIKRRPPARLKTDGKTSARPSPPAARNRLLSVEKVHCDGRDRLQRLFGIGGPASGVGFGNNTLVDNNNGNAQVSAGRIRLQPNACVPACP
jgi:hypothetical protein